MKKIMKKCLARVLALTVVASMTCSYAFAASFDDLQNAIDGNTGSGQYIGTNGGDHFGYGTNDDGTYGVESWTDSSGDRNVQLNEDVSKEDGREDGVVVDKEDGNVNIDLNGNDITSDNYDPEVGTAANGTPGEGGGYGSVIEVKDDASLTIKDTSSDKAEEQGTISGGFGLYDGGGGILVNGGTLNMEGGNISDNASYAGAGGVGVVNGGEFNMSGGTVSDNVGGGVSVKGDSDFTMSGGTISNNTANQGGGVNVSEGSSFTMDGGTISDNTATQNGGGVIVNDWSTWEKSDFTMNGGTISNNTAANSGGGVYATGKSDVTINGGTVSGNTAGVTITEDTDGNKVFTDDGIGYNTGGGIDASNLTMNGGTISGNVSGKGGGGINVGNLTLNGGTIEKNTALNGEGGGIHINGNAKITGDNGNVYIRDNRTTTQKDLGGGGIYVGTNATLELTNVVVYGNTAGINGGGLAACTTGRTFVYATDGGAFFDNHGLGGQDFSKWDDEKWNNFFEEIKTQNLNTNCDGGSVWKNTDNWSVEQKKLFVTAAQDIFTASLGGYGSYDAGAIVGNVMLGYNQQFDDPNELTEEQIAEVAKHLANWTGYSVRFDKPDELNGVGNGNNGTIFGDRFLVLTAHPTEEAKQAAMNAGKVFISGNESVYTHGGGIANNGILTIGKETQGVSSITTDLNKDWVDAEGNDLELKGGDFSFTMTGGLVDGESKTVTVKNDKDGNASFNFFGDGLFTKPGTYVFTLSEVEDEELAKLGLTYDKSQYRVTIVIKEEIIKDTIAGKPITMKSMVLEDMKIERIMDAQGIELEEPVTVDGIQFINTGKPAEPEEPKPEEPKPEEPKPEEPKPEEPKPEEPKPEEPGNPEDSEEPGTPDEPSVPPVEETTVVVPDPEVPQVNILEEEVPLVEAPEEVVIPDEDVPLANVPKTGDISMLWYLTTLLSACGLALLGLRRKNRS